MEASANGGQRVRVAGRGWGGGRFWSCLAFGVLFGQGVDHFVDVMVELKLAHCCSVGWMGGALGNREMCCGGRMG